MLRTPLSAIYLQTFGVTRSLNVLYERILDAAYGSANSRERSHIRIVLQAVVYAYNPLSMTAISDLVQMPIEQVEAALSSLHSLIYMPSSKQVAKQISILHSSFYDFMSKQVLSSKHYLDSGESQESLAQLCFSLMDNEWSGRKDLPYLIERRCENISEALAYACSSWAFHLTNEESNNKLAKLKYFFDTHLLQWMDCLSIIGKLATAMDSLHTLEC